MCARRACVLCECMYIISNISHEQGITFTQSNIIPRRTTQRDGHLVTLDMVWELDWNGWKPKTMIQFKFLSSSSNQKLRIRLRYTQPKNETRFIIWGHSGQSVVKFYVRHYFMYLYRTSDNKLKLCKWYWFCTFCKKLITMHVDVFRQNNVNSNFLL